jgi:hypothetical protein
MDLVAILTPIFSFVLIKMWLEHRAQARADNVRLLEEALKNPHVDRSTIETLTWQLTGNRRIRQQGPGRMAALILAVGWLSLFVGIGLWVAGSMYRNHDQFVGGIVTALVGFGLVTYPFALRELEARKQA